MSVSLSNFVWSLPRKMRNILVLLAAGLAAVAAVPKNPQRIVGGSVTTIEQYPEIVALLFSQLGISFSQACGGTILNIRSILTAAHCPVGDRASRWRARIGSTRSNSGGIVYNFNSIIIHPNFVRRTLDNDVAIMRTSSSIVYNSGAQPGSIAGPNYGLGDNQVVWAAGWGTTSYGGSSSVQLRHVQVWTVNQRVCVERYARVNQVVTDNMLCSGWLDVGGRDQCQGDSGGPLYHNRVVVGVCSWGRRCGLAEFPGVNARVTRFSYWIQANA